MATRRIPLALTIVLKLFRFLIHLAVCGGIVFVMVKTFKRVDDPGIDGIRAFYILLFENVILSGFLVYTAMWTRRAIRERSSSYEL